MYSKKDFSDKLTKNFKLSEFLFSKFFDKEEQQEVIKSFLSDSNLRENIEVLASSLQALREAVNAPVSINIAYRPKWYEHKQGRSGNSQHCLGKAADIRIEGLEPKQVQYIINKLIKEGKMHNGGLGSYSSFTHYDVRPNAARWRG